MNYIKIYGFLFIGIITALLFVGAYIHRNDPPISEYQITVKKDSCYLMEGYRFVGSCKLNQIDSLIINDNQ